MVYFAKVRGRLRHDKSRRVRGGGVSVPTEESEYLWHLHCHESKFSFMKESANISLTHSFGAFKGEEEGRDGRVRQDRSFGQTTWTD